MLYQDSEEDGLDDEGDDEEDDDAGNISCSHTLLINQSIQKALTQRRG